MRHARINGPHGYMVYRIQQPGTTICVCPARIFPSAAALPVIAKCMIRIMSRERYRMDKKKKKEFFQISSY